jgi:hypothetical protein
MANKQAEASPPTRNTAPRGARSALWWCLACAVLALAVAGAYLGIYRAKGFRLPIGFDAPWYIWRASYLSAHGMGRLGTSIRPGSAVLASVLGALTGRSQFTIAVLIGPVLAGMFAIAMGALVWACLGPGRWRWLGAVVVGGCLLGGTRLVDENVATLFFLCVVVAALVPLIAAAVVGRSSGWGRRLGAAIVLLVAAGLVHWLFLAVVSAVLALAVVFLARRSAAQLREGVPLTRTESGTLGGALVGAGAIVAAVVFGVLRAPANTIQVKEDPERFVPKLTNDASRLRLWLLGPVSVLGAWALAAGVGRPRPRRRAVLLAILAAWAVVTLGGIAFGIVTKKLPPHRFLELVIAVPVVVAIAEAVGWLADSVRPRGGMAAGWTVAVVATAMLAVPGLYAWYASGAPKPWMNQEALREARIMAVWTEQTPRSGPFIVWVSPFGPAGTLSAALKERTLRAALPPQAQERFHMVAGSPGHLIADGDPLAGLAPAMREAVLPYWRDAQPFLSRVTVRAFLFLRAFNPSEFPQDAAQPGVRTLGPGVVLAAAGKPPAPIDVPAQTIAYPGAVRAAVWAIVILLLLAAAGYGWTMLVVGNQRDPAVVFGLTPAVGAAAVVIVGSVVSRAGAGVGDVVGWLVWGATAIGGLAAARLMRPRAATGDGKEALPTTAAEPIDAPGG